MKFLGGHIVVVNFSLNFWLDVEFHCVSGWMLLVLDEISWWPSSPWVPGFRSVFVCLAASNSTRQTPLSVSRHVRIVLQLSAVLGGDLVGAILNTRLSVLAEAV